MSLTRKDIEAIAHLARLNLTDAEIPVYVESLSNIMSFVGDLDKAKTDGITPMAHPMSGLSQRLRTDDVLETDRHELYQKNAPQVAAALYVVPKVIE
jgi:aspartyl-tRNA(Asn)/glutamyl-tRNA(Gln) amidotransferase subunit C